MTVHNLLIPVKKITFQKGFLRLTGPLKPETSRDKTIKNSEGYKIKIRPKGVEIFSATEAGTYYAKQTLKDLAVIYGTLRNIKATPPLLTFAS